MEKYYNISGFNEEKNINIVKLVIDILKEEITNNVEYKKVLKTDVSNINYDLITYVQDRLGHDMRYAIDPSKIAKDLAWYPEYPETDFETGIRKTIKWYLENQDWVNEVMVIIKNTMKECMLIDSIIKRIFLRIKT